MPKQTCPLVDAVGYDVVVRSMSKPMWAYRPSVFNNDRFCSVLCFLVSCNTFRFKESDDPLNCNMRSIYEAIEYW